MRPIVKYTVEVLCGHLSAKTAESIMMPFGLIIIIINDNVYGAVLMTMLLLDSAVAGSGVTGVFGARGQKQ